MRDRRNLTFKEWWDEEVPAESVSPYEGYLTVGITLVVFLLGVWVG